MKIDNPIFSDSANIYTVKASSIESKEPRPGIFCYI